MQLQRRQRNIKSSLNELTEPIYNGRYYCWFFVAFLEREK